MNIVTHFLLSWAVAEQLPCSDRDRALITWAGAAPDLDGLGVVVDSMARISGHAPTDWYLRYHHQLLHGLPGALMLALLAAALARKRGLTFWAVLLTVHLHLLCDIVGSRGPTLDDIWPIHYLAPLSSALTLSWSGQWPLNGWQNASITLLLLLYGFARSVTAGRSPLLVIHRGANRVFVDTVRARWARLRGGRHH